MRAIKNMCLCRKVYSEAQNGLLKTRPINEQEYVWMESIMICANHNKY